MEMNYIIQTIYNYVSYINTFSYKNTFSEEVLERPPVDEKIIPSEYEHAPAIYKVVDPLSIHPRYFASEYKEMLLYYIANII